MTSVQIKGERFVFKGGFAFRLERTLRVPSDGRTYPLPPSLGAFPIYRTADYEVTRQAAWRGTFFVPLYQWEAVWISFDAEDWRPKAVQVAAGGVNVLTGERFPSKLKVKPQNYLVCPTQPWIDGIRTGTGTVRQFVAAPLGQGLTLEEQITGEAAKGGLQVRVISAKKGIFPTRRPKGISSAALYGESLFSGNMGLAAGGAIGQKVYPDPHGLRAWDQESSQDVSILIVNSEEFRAITGQAPPTSPITAEQYDRYGLPWFELYDEQRGDIGAVVTLKKLTTVAVEGDRAKAARVVKIRRASYSGTKKPP